MIMLVLIEILALVSAAELLLYYMHMYQLNSYMAVRQMRWLKANVAFGNSAFIGFSDRKPLPSL